MGRRYQHTNDIQADLLREMLDRFQFMGAKTTPEERMQVMEGWLIEKIKACRAGDEFMDKEEVLERRIAIADQIVQEAIDQRVQLGNEQAVVALAKLVTWVPGFRDDVPLVYKDHYSEQEEKDERKRCDQAPMATEAWTYEMFGKEEGRTFLALVRNVAQALGVEDIYQLQRDPEKYHGEGYIKPSEQEELDRRERWRKLRERAGNWWNGLNGDAKHTHYNRAIQPDINPKTPNKGNISWKKLDGAERRIITEWYLKNKVKNVGGK